MAGGGLFDPLGTDRPASEPRSGLSRWLVALCVVLVGVAGLFGTAAIRNGGDGGEPRVVAGIETLHHPDPPQPSPPLAADTTTRAPVRQSGAVTSSDQEVEVENGVRVIRPRRTGSAAAGVVVKVPDVASAAVEALPAADDLLESGPSGLLPRVAPDGRRPAEVYAGATVPGSSGKPLVSIVVGGLGTSGSPAQAPADWPAGVTLGFAVDGTDLARQVATARAAGHEVVLVLAPGTGGFPGAAATPSGGTSAASARDRLLWHMSRFSGYAGVIMDPTGLATATAATDILEMTRRGLYVVDTPVARRSTAPTSSARVAGSPMATVDMMLMESAGSETPTRSLERLASLARSDGSAIGFVPASSRSLAAISEFAATLADTGIALVPLGAVVKLRQSQQARPFPVATP